MMYTFKTSLPTVTDWLKLWLVVLVVSLSFAQTSPAANFEGCVFLDQNGNSTYDVGEPVQANAVVYLMDNQLVQAGQGGFFTTITGGDGCYYFFGNNASNFNSSILWYTSL